MNLHTDTYTKEEIHAHFNYIVPYDIQEGTPKKQNLLIKNVYLFLYV